MEKNENIDTIQTIETNVETLIMPVRSCAQCTTVRVPKYEQHTQVDVRERQEKQK